MEIQDVIKELKQLKQMRDLDAEIYAIQGGWADVVAQQSGIKPTQLRKIFHYIKDLKLKVQRDEKAFNKAKMAMLMPMLAYAKGRNHIKDEFYQILSTCFGPQKCSTAQDFIEAANFLEAIMAYHKYHNR
jgi:CRISPR type III-A-associated protein Csm2